MNLDIIKEAEGLRLKPYKCSAGIPTIGYGNTFYKDGTKVTMQDKEITIQYAEELIQWYVEKYVISIIKSVITKQLTDNQYSAIASFIYNVGNTAFKNSTLAKKINKGTDEEIKQQFRLWNKASGKIIEGLKNRREKEIKLFFTK